MPNVNHSRRAQRARALIEELYGIPPGQLRMECREEGLTFSWGQERLDRISAHASRAARGHAADVVAAGEVHDLQRELLLHVGIRAHVLARKDLIRDEIPRNVAYDDVEALWTEIGRSVHQTDFGAPLRGCYLDLRQRLLQILETAQVDRLDAWARRDGDLDLLVHSTRRWWHCIEVTAANLK